MDPIKLQKGVGVQQLKYEVLQIAGEFVEELQPWWLRRNVDG